MTINIEELRRLAQAATPGPWKMLPVGDGRQKFAVADSEFLSILTVTDEGGATFGTVYDDDDARFIAAANPATVIEILDRLEAAEKERDALRAELDALRNQEPVAAAHRWMKGHPVLRAVGDAALTPETKLYVRPVPAQVVPDGCSMRRVVCAANLDASGAIIIGVRHWDAFMHAQADAQCWCVGEHDQGFIDQFGAFMSRTEAWKVAEAAGQIIRRVGGDAVDGGTLYSENLY